jgi:hypothetical protein
MLYNDCPFKDISKLRKAFVGFLWDHKQLMESNLIESETVGPGIPGIQISQDPFPAETGSSNYQGQVLNCGFQAAWDLIP